MKLIVDWFNGGMWQWKYYCPTVGRWFDYGCPFATKQEAEDYVSQE